MHEKTSITEVVEALTEWGYLDEESSPPTTYEALVDAVQAHDREGGGKRVLMFDTSSIDPRSTPFFALFMEILGAAGVCHRDIESLHTEYDLASRTARASCVRHQAQVVPRSSDNVLSRFALHESPEDDRCHRWEAVWRQHERGIGERFFKIASDLCWKLFGRHLVVLRNDDGFTECVVVHPELASVVEPYFAAAVLERSAYPFEGEFQPHPDDIQSTPAQMMSRRDSDGVIHLRLSWRQAYQVIEVIEECLDYVSSERMSLSESPPRGVRFQLNKRQYGGVSVEVQEIADCLAEARVWGRYSGTVLDVSCEGVDDGV